MTDRGYYRIIIWFLILDVIIVGALMSINIKTDTINKQLNKIIKLEQKQITTETPETTTAELIIEENTLSN